MSVGGITKRGQTKCIVQALLKHPSGKQGGMAYDPGAIGTTLAAAVGDDPALIADLRSAFVESAERVLTAMTLAVDAEDWRAAAWRLRGLAASFGAVRLMALATEVAEDPRDAEGLKKLRRAISRL